jgi:predicted transcriptional regulator
MTNPKAMTIRLSPEQAQALDTVATVDNLPVSEVIRTAIAQHIDTRKSDPAFREGLNERINRAKRFLAR